MGAKGYQRCVAGGHRDFNVLVFTAPPCTAGAKGRQPWAYALRSGVCPDRRRARRTASALLEVAMQSAFQEKCSYTMAVRGLLDGESVAMATCMRSLTQFTVKLPWPRPLTCYNCRKGLHK